MTAEVVIGQRGRLVLPAALRRELGITEGTVLVARVEGDSVVLEPRDAVLRRIRERFKEVPPRTSLVDDLIGERRREAKREARR